MCVSLLGGRKRVKYSSCDLDVCMCVRVCTWACIFVCAHVYVGQTFTHTNSMQVHPLLSRAYQRKYLHAHARSCTLTQLSFLSHSLSRTDTSLSLPEHTQTIPLPPSLPDPTHTQTGEAGARMSLRRRHSDDEQPEIEP